MTKKKNRQAENRFKRLLITAGSLLDGNEDDDRDEDDDDEDDKEGLIFAGVLGLRTGRDSLLLLFGFNAEGTKFTEKKKKSPNVIQISATVLAIFLQPLFSVVKLSLASLALVTEGLKGFTIATFLPPLPRLDLMAALKQQQTQQQQKTKLMLSVVHESVLTLAFEVRDCLFGFLVSSEARALLLDRVPW